MGKAPCCDKASVKKGPWSPEEDAKLKAYIEKHGTGGNWIALPQKMGLKRCGKSCRLRWLNYLRPNIKHGGFSEQEENIICSLYLRIGSRWSIIAAQLPGRTDNDIKNYWNTRLKRKLLGKPQLKDQRSSWQSMIQINGCAKDEVENVKVVHPQQAMNSIHRTVYFPEMIPQVKSENRQCPVSYGFSYSQQDQICGNSSMDLHEHLSAMDGSTSGEHSRTSSTDFGLNMAALESYREPGNYYFPDQQTDEGMTVYGNQGHDYDELTSLYQPIGLDNLTVIDMSSGNCNHPMASNYEDGLQGELQSIGEDPNFFRPQ